MGTRDVYARKISSEEAREGYIMVLKARLAFFPPAGSPFDLDDEGRKTRAKVESYGCACRGPDLPHEHYFIRRAGLTKGDRVEIERAGGSPPAYRLRALR